MRQFFLDTTAAGPPVPGDLVTLDPEESHHLLKVLRARSDADLQLVDGHGHRISGRAAGRDGRRVRVEVHTVTVDPDEGAPPRLRLACGVVKGRRWAWALEKAVECGVHAIVPLLTEHGVVEPGKGRRERWQGILRGALKQSGRCLLPELDEPLSLSAFLAAEQGGPLAFGAVPSAREGVPTGWGGGPETGLAPPQWLTVAVGPEGGWTAAEHDALAAAGGGVLDLGPHVLRTETAVVAALVLAQTLRGRWRAAGVPPA